MKARARLEPLPRVIAALTSIFSHPGAVRAASAREPEGHRPASGAGPLPPRESGSLAGDLAGADAPVAFYSSPPPSSRCGPPVRCGDGVGADVVPDVACATGLPEGCRNLEPARRPR